MSNSSWIVRNVSQEARIAAAKAAKKENKKMGPWLSDLILREAQDVLTRRNDVAKQSDNIDINKLIDVALDKKMSRLEERLDKLANKKSFLEKLFRFPR